MRPPLGAGQGGRHVVVIASDPRLRAMLRVAVSSVGFIVDAENAWDAVDRGRQPDAVVIDLTDGFATGPDVVAALKASWPTSIVIGLRAPAARFGRGDDCGCVVVDRAVGSVLGALGRMLGPAQPVRLQ